MKLILSGVIEKVSPIREQGDFKLQNVQMKVDNFDSQSGELISSEIYEFAVFNKKIAELKADQLVGKKCRAVTWTKSIGRESNGNTFYNIVLNASAIDII
jgi:hypothetical protein